jgi:hypothetical protein
MRLQKSCRVFWSEKLLHPDQSSTNLSKVEEIKLLTIQIALTVVTIPESEPLGYGRGLTLMLTCFIELAIL